MRKIILASGSPRRKDIMEFLGVPFEIVVSDFPEENVRWEDFDEPADYVSTIAMGKALTIAPRFEDALIIAADTSVFLEGNVYNKPSDLDEARRILQMLRGKRHQVTTAMVFIDTLTRQQEIQTVSSFVTFLPFSDEQLENYIDTSESLGKAGAYAIQLGAKGLVKLLEGSLSNVVGLPIEEAAGLLEQFNIPVDVDVKAIVEEHFTHQ
ncbi:MAG: nucleoside triphosphate pyrophosphatase [Candidatus Woesebacteria bacterium]